MILQTRLLTRYFSCSGSTSPSASKRCSITSTSLTPSTSAEAAVVSNSGEMTGETMFEHPATLHHAEGLDWMRRDKE